MLNLLLKREMDRLIKWLTEERGMEVVERGEDFVNCRDGNNLVHFRYVYLDIPNEADIAKRAAEVAGSRTAFNKAYLVVDRPSANFVDGKLMRRLGIGIIVMGSEITEAMASMPTARPTVSDGAIAEVMSEVRAVRDRLADVERRVGELESMIRTRNEREKQVEVVTKDEANDEAGEVDGGEGRVQGDVPQFMRENPWLDILGKRGK